MADYPGALAPPDGITADINNPQDVLRTVNFVVQGLTIVVVTVLSALKVYAKLTVLEGSLGWEDYLSCITYVLTVGYCVCSVFLSVYGGGYNQWDVSKEAIVPFYKSGYAATIFYAPMTLFIKIVLLLVIARVFGSVYKKTILGIYVFMAMLVMYYTIGLILKIRICWPISAYWEGDLTKCLDQAAIITADSIISVVSDLTILFIPTPLTWSLQMPKKKKFRVIGVLCAGGLATAFSIYRLDTIVRQGSSSNQTIVFVKVVLSGNAELGIGLICACLPAVNALCHRRQHATGYTESRIYTHSKGHETMSKGKIYVNHAFHTEITPRTVKEVGDNAFELYNDDAQLVAHAQDNPKNSWSNKSLP